MPRELTAFAGRLWFTAEAPGLGREPWTSDGTAAGTVPVADILPGSAGSAPSLLAVHAGRLWFFADDGLHGRELWSSDGTAAGTRLEVDVTPGSASLPPQILVSLGDRLVFSLLGGGLWVSDGTAAGTRKIHDREPDFPVDRWIVFKGRLWFVSHGTLWTTDGTEAGTAELLDRDGRQIFTPARFAVLGDRLVLTAQDLFGLTLFESDGTPAGTFAVEPRIALNNPFELAGAGNRVFFPGYDPATGTELWAVRP
jgi:ELWxxDGT repeat protein